VPVNTFRTIVLLGCSNTHKGNLTNELNTTAKSKRFSELDGYISACGGVLHANDAVEVVY
jgi:hypothetical protein